MKLLGIVIFYKFDLVKLKLPITDKNYVLTLDKNKLIIEYDNKKIIIEKAAVL